MIPVSNSAEISFWVKKFVHLAEGCSHGHSHRKVCGWLVVVCGNGIGKEVHWGYFGARQGAQLHTTQCGEGEWRGSERIKERERELGREKEIGLSNWVKSANTAKGI